MILGVILVCISAVDIYTCEMVPNTNKLFPSIEECEEVGHYTAEHISIQYNLHTKVQCFETDFFELL
jgi:hypothetical protein